MSGALAERVFVDKMTGVGFGGIEIHERHPFGIDDAAEYPLFTPDLIALMRDLLPAERQAEVAVAITVTADRPRATDG